MLCDYFVFFFFCLKSFPITTLEFFAKVFINVMVIVKMVIYYLELYG